MISLDPGTAALLERLATRGEVAMFAGTDTPAGIDAARARYATLMGETVRPVDHAPERRDDGPVPVRVHRPAAPTGALVVHVHGGGWVLGGGEVYDPVAQRLADDTGAVVVALDHRLAPEHPFPAPYDDVLAAVDWVLAHADEWDADPARLGLAGDSAGANLAAGAALALRDSPSLRSPLRDSPSLRSPLRDSPSLRSPRRDSPSLRSPRRDAGPAVVGTLLVYPPPDFEGRYPSVRENGEGYFLTSADVVACSKLYLGGTSPKGETRLSPLRADLAGLGPTIVATAGFDPLRDAGHAFAEALATAGVDVRRREHPSLTHGFLGFTGVSSAADEAVSALHAEFATLLDAAGHP